MAAKKPETERYEVDGHVVELVRMEPDKRRSYCGTAENAVRSQWELRIDGVVRGYAVFPLGVGKPWRLFTLLPKDLTPYNDGPVKFAWREPDGESVPGTYHGWDGRFDSLVQLYQGGATYGREWDRTQTFRSREAIAQEAPAILAMGKLPCREEVEALAVSAKAAEVARNQREAAERTRRDREHEQWKARVAAERVRQEEIRIETVEGLESIWEKFSSEMDNLQKAALTRALDHYREAAQKN